MTRLRKLLPPKEFFILFAAQLFSYFILTVNYRACAQGRYIATVGSDLVAAANGYFIIRRVGENKSKWGLAGYIIGGGCGSAIGIFVTKVIFHQ